jgi:hypothetical protein
MLKMPTLVKEFGQRSEDHLKRLLSDVPAIEIESLDRNVRRDQQQIDLVAHVRVAGRSHTIVCEVKDNGQPRYVRMALLQLQSYIRHVDSPATPLLIAPYLSPESQALCRELGVGFLDFEGNARLVFDGVFVERRVDSKPPVARRELKSLFKPKSAQALRVLLRDPKRSWRVAALAAAARMSIGHINNVRVGLLDREWARLEPSGLLLSQPDALLDAWRDAYEPPAGDRLTFYTTLHGAAFDTAARGALGAADGQNNVMFASFSAAQWLAPYARVGTHYFYANQAGLGKLQQQLVLSSPIKGENVIVVRLYDDDLFRDAAEPAAGIICTRAVQTYLDLAAAGERGREAADHLRRERLQWHP